MSDQSAFAMVAGAAGQSTLAGAMDMGGATGFDMDKEIGSIGSSSTESMPPPTVEKEDVGLDNINGFYEDDTSAPLLVKPVDEGKEYGSLRELVVQRTHHHVDRQGVFHTGYVYDPLMMLHQYPVTQPRLNDDDGSEEGEPYHPEQPERIVRIRNILEVNGCLKRMKRINIREITRSEIMLVHDVGMWEGLERSVFFHPSTLAKHTHVLETSSSLYLNQHSAQSARLSCGGVVEMCDAVASGRVRNGFAIVRPPGHHAEPTCAMGFCFYNNVAVATAYLKAKYGEREDEKRCKRILILDWDVHHGNGTQKAFWDDEDVLFISIHRYENGTFYPSGKAGGADKVGEGAGRGRTVNIPWPRSGMDDGDYLAAFSKIVMPIAREFAPDFVIISAGFDAALGDELGQCAVTPTGYAQMTHELASLANGRIVAALEGGYNIDAIAASALAVTKVLLGDPTPSLTSEQSSCSRAAYETIQMVERIQSEYWKCMHTSQRTPNRAEEEGLTAISIFELVASHRHQRLQNKYGLITKPTSEDPSDRGMCLCTKDLLAAPDKDLLVFVHDMGNLRVGHPWDGESTLVAEEAAYVVDASSEVVEWALESNMSLIDINVAFEAPFEAPSSTSSQRLAMAESQERAVELLFHAWDNLISLAGYKKIVLLGFGSGCSALMKLIEQRNVDDKVCAIVQIPLRGPLPFVRRGKKRSWYHSCSRVYLPYDHEFFQVEDEAVKAKRFGTIVRAKQTHSLQLLRQNFVDIESFVKSSLTRIPDPMITD